MDRWPSANIFLLKAAWAALESSVLGAVDREPEWEPSEISEKHDFASQRRGRGKCFYNT